MGNVRIELNSAAVRDLLTGPEIQADLARRAAAIAAAAGGHGTYGHDVQVGRTRARGMVWTADGEAMASEARHRTLSAALDAGR